MRRYAVNFNQTVNSAAATNTYVMQGVTAASRTVAVYEVILGNDSVVADAQVEVDITQVTASTAGSALTPVPLELGASAPAAVTVWTSTPTTVTVTGLPLLRIAFNTRATVRWAAVDPDSRILFPAGGGTAGTCMIYNQQPGTVSGLTLSHQAFFVE